MRDLGRFSVVISAFTTAAVSCFTIIGEYSVSQLCPSWSEYVQYLVKNTE